MQIRRTFQQLLHVELDERVCIPKVRVLEQTAKVMIHIWEHHKYGRTAIFTEVF